MSESNDTATTCLVCIIKSIECIITKLFTYRAQWCMDWSWFFFFVLMYVNLWLIFNPSTPFKQNIYYKIDKHDLEHSFDLDSQGFFKDIFLTICLFVFSKNCMSLRIFKVCIINGKPEISACISVSTSNTNAMNKIYIAFLN